MVTVRYVEICSGNHPIASPTHWWRKGKFNGWNGRALCQRRQEDGEKQKQSKERREVAVCVRVQPLAFAFTAERRDSESVCAGVWKKRLHPGQSAHFCPREEDRVVVFLQRAYAGCVCIMGICMLCVCVCVRKKNEIHKARIYSGLAGLALETVALLWVF